MIVCITQIFILFYFISFFKIPLHLFFQVKISAYKLENVFMLQTIEGLSQFLKVCR